MPIFLTLPNFIAGTFCFALFGALQCDALSHQCGLIDGIEGQIRILQEGFTVQQPLTNAAVFCQDQLPPGGICLASSSGGGVLLHKEETNGLNHPAARGAGGQTATRQEAATYESIGKS